MNKIARWTMPLALAAALASARSTTQAAQAQTFTTLYSFCSKINCADGGGPAYGLIQATDGDLYGITAKGPGSIFKFPTSGTSVTVHRFFSTTESTKGLDPVVLIQATNGDFYGTTLQGGADEVDCRKGCGTFFKMTPGGLVKTLYSFCSDSQGNCLDGVFPAGLIRGTDGNFYGVTAAGGLGGWGTVFKITPGGMLTTLHRFCSQSVGDQCVDGGAPSNLLQGTDGDFYGTTRQGGAIIGNCDNGGCGTVFKITALGKLKTLHNFNETDGAYPGWEYGPLIQATDGNIYGTTVYGGSSGACEGGCGTVFKMTTSGTLTSLHSFNKADGATPNTPLIQATDGNIYGTTIYGGSSGACVEGYGCGTVFEITTSGTLTSLHSFCLQSDCLDGSVPQALIQDTDGNFYGTTALGGANNYGTLFTLNTGLGPFIALQATTEPVGAEVNILGTDLTGATSVTFNGTAAAFTIVSASEITAEVPPGATTGTVQAVTPGGTLTSNVANIVRAATPAFSLPAGTYPGTQTVSITDATADAAIYYTTDGTPPPNSPTAKVYSTPISISSTETLKAVAIAPDFAQSGVEIALYTIE